MKSYISNYGQILVNSVLRVHQFVIQNLLTLLPLSAHSSFSIINSEAEKSLSRKAAIQNNCFILTEPHCRLHASCEETKRLL